MEQSPHSTSLFFLPYFRDNKQLANTQEKKTNPHSPCIQLAFLLRTTILVAISDLIDKEALLAAKWLFSTEIQPAIADKKLSYIP
jgi:hypothetical protein